MDAGELAKVLVPLAGSLLVMSKIIDKLIPSRVEKILLDIQSKTNALYDAHLGDTAHDEEGRLKWWFPTNLPAMFQRICTGIDKLVVSIDKLEVKLDVTDRLATAHEKQVDAISRMAAAAEKAQRDESN